jgi:hypothetical protein
MGYFEESSHKSSVRDIPNAVKNLERFKKNLLWLRDG